MSVFQTKPIFTFTLSFKMHQKFFMCVLFFVSVSSLKFDTEYQWSYVNFTWPSYIDYSYASHKKDYIPENNIPSAIKVYRDRIYVALGRRLKGTPVTLAFLKDNQNRNNLENPLLTPFPSWEMNNVHNCESLQNVNSFEIDSRGVMWVIDGIRNNQFTNCPAKLVLIDIRSNKVIQNYDFPEHLTYQAYLADIVVDNEYAYMSDNSEVDPGLIVYSKAKNKAWKIRDSTMFADINAVNFTINKQTIKYYSGIYGLALSPLKTRKNGIFLHYNPISSYNIHSINVKILQDEKLCSTSTWRQHIYKNGRKIDQSSGLTMDNKGNLYFGLLNRNGIARWNIYKPFKTASIMLEEKVLNWVSSFGFNMDGSLYILTNSFGNYIANGIYFNKEIKFRILKIRTNTRSYLYTQ